MTTDKNNFCHPGATAPGFKGAAREYACREAIRLGVREARTAKERVGTGASAGAILRETILRQI